LGSRRSTWSIAACAFIAFVFVLPVASAYLGNGTIEVYVDTWGGTCAPTDKEYYYYIFPGQTYYIRIVSIIEFDPAVTKKIDVMIKTESGTPYELIFNDVPLIYEGYVYDSGTRTWYHVHHADLPSWVAPNLAEGTTLIVYYRSSNPGEWYRAHSVRCRLGGMFVIPDVPLGAFGSVATMAAALGFSTILVKRHAHKSIRKYLYM